MENILFLKRFCYLQSSEVQALLEVPGHPGLAGSTAEAVARGLGRAQSSSRQPLPGLRPLGLRMEVCYYFFIVGFGPLAWFFCCCPVTFFDSALTIIFFLDKSKFFNKHRIRGFSIIVGSDI